MADVAVAPLPVGVRRPSRIADRMFFTAMPLIMLMMVLWGFSKTYYMAGMVRAPLPNALIHVHGAAFSLWMVLLIVQTGLIAAHRAKLHMTLGLGGFALAAIMVVLGLLAAVDALRRGVGHLGLDALQFFIIPVTAIGIFAVCIFFAYRRRRNMELHKRLIIIGTISLMDAAIGRWPVPFFQAHPPAMDLPVLALLLMIVAFDVVNLRRVSKATIWGGLGLMAVHIVRVPFAHTGVWLAFAKHFA